MNRYSKLQIQLHWLTLVLIAIACAAMELRGLFPKGSSAYLLMRETHYNAGIFILLLMIIRVIINNKYITPAITPPPPAWQMISAKFMQTLLYISFLVLPISGLAIMFFGGKAWSLLGIDIPTFANTDGEVKSVAKTIHESLASIGYLLITLHAGAALIHHYIQKDNTLVRMLPEHQHDKK
ncbi:TPA: cytochrome b [Escherichia coli]|nr:cytochrome b [Escherichia coli]